MLSATHKIIAHKAYEAIKSQLGIKIDYKSLIQGSVAPDYSLSMMFRPHSKDESIGLVHNNMDWLFHKSFSHQRKDIREFSFKLGVIIHFVSDYFCIAHNDEFYNNMYHHYKYEKKLKKFCCKFIQEYYESIRQDMRVVKDIKGFIDEKHQEYMTVRRSMKNDLVYSLQVSIAVSLSILSYCLDKSDCKMYVGNLENLRTA